MEDDVVVMIDDVKLIATGWQYFTCMSTVSCQTDLTLTSGL